MIFEEIADSYLVSGDLVCSYSLTPGLEPGHGDRVGLYRLPFLQVAFVEYKLVLFFYMFGDLNVTAARECLLRVGCRRSWAPTQCYLSCLTSAQTGGFLPVPIPQVEAFQVARPSLFALRGDNGVAGASIPFQLRLEPGERALQEELGGLETKYTSLLHHSETLQKELETKQQSFVVLEQQHKSMREEAKKKTQMESDLAELVAAR